MTTTSKISIENQLFGVEIEMTGITRENTVKAIAEHFGTVSEICHVGGSSYDIWTAEDNKGRTWKCMNDSSIEAVDEEGNRIFSGHSKYSCELVTPILRYEDIESLKTIMNKLSKAGAIANSSTGIHVHVGAENHTAKTIATLLNFAASREDILYEALEVSSDRETEYCRKTNKRLAEFSLHAENMSEIENIWYSGFNDGYNGGVSREHYNSTRYHGINLHSLFTDKGVEFRYFNGTTDADKIEAYIQLCLGINAYCINNPGAVYGFSEGNYSPEEKARHMKRFLRKRLGMDATNYKTLNRVMTAVWAH